MTLIMFYLTRIALFLNPIVEGQRALRGPESRLRGLHEAAEVAEKALEVTGRASEEARIPKVEIKK